MRLTFPSEGVAHATLRALHTVCLAHEGVTPLEASFLRGVQEHVLHSRVDLTSLEPITGPDLAAAIPAFEDRARVLTFAVVAACIDGEATEDEVAVIDMLAKALELDLAPVRTARKLAKKQLFLARIDIARRALAGFKIRQTLHEGGPVAVIKQFLPMLGLPDARLSARYRELADYPQGSLGRAYFDFVTASGFALPGEDGAAPEIIVLHDCLHVLGGYGTSAPEEIEVSSFQAGCHDDDPLYGLLFGLAQYHLGVQVAPVAPAGTLNADPERMLHAFARGCGVQRDMWSDFVPWEHFARPLDEVRAELGITASA